MWLNKQTIWESERISQTSGKIFSTIWSKLHSRSPAENCQELFLEKNPSSIVSRTLRWRFLDFRQKFQQGCQNCVLAVRRKIVGIVPEKKEVNLANSENGANFFLEISVKFSSNLSKLLNSSRLEKNIVEKTLFFEKPHFFRSFPTFYQKFQDLPPIFFIRVVILAFSMSRRTLPNKLDFLPKKL